MPQSSRKRARAHAQPAEATTSAGRAAAAGAQPHEALHAWQARLAAILDIADDAIITIDRDQRITLFNQGAEKIFGYTAAEVLGQPLDLLLPARFHASHRRHIGVFAASPDPARRMAERQDIYGARKDGTEFPAEASIARLDLAGETSFTVILRDITARKRIEQTLRDQNAELARAIQAKDRFLANMSHELRTPLNAIIGFTGTLLMRLPGPLTADQERQLKTIQASGRHLLSLINDLLDLAKIESGKVVLSPELVVCQEVVDEVLASLRPLADQKGLRFTADGTTERIVLRTDRRAFSQIIINLANNAIKFTERGEVRIELARDGQLGAVAVRVSDTGIGIRPEDRSRIFQAFEQTDSGGARRREGTGLGLHLSLRLARLLGGRISFESEYGVGSTFTLTIPEH